MSADRPTAAVVGTGFAGAVHADALRRLGVEIAGVVGSSRAGRLEELLADPAVDVVHLATPNHLHHPQAKAALAEGVERSSREQAWVEVA